MTEPVTRPTPEENLAVVLVLVAGLDPYVQFCTVLTAFAESDFESGAVQRETVGVFQQNPKYWPSADKGTAAQCKAFLEAFQSTVRYHNGDPVHDCWIVQRWLLPGAIWPDTGPNFEAEKRRDKSETNNYQRRLTAVAQIIKERRLP